MMSQDSTSLVTGRTAIQRLADSRRNVTLGVILAVAALVVLFWNERRVVHSLGDIGARLPVAVPVDPQKADPANNGRLVFIVADVKADPVLEDGAFGMSLPAMRYRRRVEMRQWEETIAISEKAMDTEPRPSYDERWSDRQEDSSRFRRPTGHKNRHVMPFGQLRLEARTVTAGAFIVPKSLLDRLRNADWEGLDLPEKNPGTADLPGYHTVKFPGAVASYYYNGRDVNKPQLGEVRISFQAIKPGTYSILAKQGADGKTLEPFVTASGDRVFEMRPARWRRRTCGNTWNCSNRHWRGCCVAAGSGCCGWGWEWSWRRWWSCGTSRRCGGESWAMACCWPAG